MTIYDDLKNLGGGADYAAILRAFAAQAQSDLAALAGGGLTDNLVYGANTQSLAVDKTLVAGDSKFQALTFTAAALSASLPDATTLVEGRPWVIALAVGSEAVDILDADTTVLVTLQPGETIWLTPTDIATAAGTWAQYVFPTGIPPVINSSLVINGGMPVAERGSQAGQGAAPAYSACDRWLLFSESGATPARVTTSRSSGASAEMAAAGFANSLQVDCTTIDPGPAGSALLAIEQRLEGQDLQHLLWGTAEAKDVTVSFWWQSPKAGLQCVYLNNADGNSSYLTEITVTAANVAQFFEVTFPGDTTGTPFNNDANHSLGIGLPLLAGTGYLSPAPDTWAGAGGWRTTANQQNLMDNTANNVFLGGVKLEVSSVATAFEHESYGETLKKCQRYYWRYTEENTNAAGLGTGYVTSTVAARITIHFPEEMRIKASPVLSVSNATDFKIGHAAATTVTTAMANQNGGSTRYAILKASVAAGLTVGQGCELRTDGTSSGWLAYDAEL